MSFLIYLFLSSFPLFLSSLLLSLFLYSLPSPPSSFLPFPRVCCRNGIKMRGGWVPVEDRIIHVHHGQLITLVFFFATSSCAMLCYLFYAASHTHPQSPSTAQAQKRHRGTEEAQYWNTQTREKRGEHSWYAFCLHTYILYSQCQTIQARARLDLLVIRLVDWYGQRRGKGGLLPVHKKRERPERAPNCSRERRSCLLVVRQKLTFSSLPPFALLLFIPSYRLFPTTPLSPRLHHRYLEASLSLSPFMSVVSSSSYL